MPLPWIFGGLLLGGLRDPWLWTAAACGLWAFALAGAAASRRALVAWAPFLAWLLVSTLLSDQPWKCVLADARWAGLALFCALFQAADPSRLRRPWLIGLGIAVVVLGLAGVWTAAGRPGQYMYGLLPPYYNYTAFVIEAAAAACAAILLAPSGPRPKERRAAAGVLAFSALWLAYARARAGLLGAGAAIVFSAWRRGKLHGRHAAIVAAAAGALAAAAVLNVGGVGHWLKLDQPQSFKRPQIWRAALQAWRQRPIAGWGPGNFEEGFLRHNFPSGQGVGNYQFSTPLAHSEPLNALAETGAVGLVLLLWALARPLRWPIQRAGDDWPREAALAAAVAMSAHCLVDNFFQIPALAMLFLSAWALAAPRREESAARWPFPVLAVGLAVAALGLAPTAVGARLAKAVARTDDPARRLDLLRGQESLFPADAGLREAASRAALSLRPPDDETARRELALARDLNPTNALYPGWLAEISAAQGLWGQAEAEARAAVALEPNDLGARLLLAQALKTEGRVGEAKAQLAEFQRRLMIVGAPGSGYERALVDFDQRRLATLENSLAGR